MPEWSDHIVRKIGDSLSRWLLIALTAILMTGCQEYYSITSPFGELRPGQEARNLGVRPIHLGVDIPAPVGTLIFAAAHGRVDHIGSSPVCGSDTVGFRVEGAPEHLGVRYSHIKAIEIYFGDVVTAGQYLGTVDECGRNPHLHFEVVLNGNHVNPEPYLFGKDHKPECGDANRTYPQDWFELSILAGKAPLIYPVECF
jgi:murein DD-endopeptidase MepM/ murein hydrolase activator NlpD